MAIAMTVGCGQAEVDSASCDGGGWFDAEGVLAFCGIDLLYEDPLGTVWQVDDVTATIGPLIVDGFSDYQVISEFFTDSECLGEGWRHAVAPTRTAFVVDSVFDVPEEAHVLNADRISTRTLVAVIDSGRTTCVDGIGELEREVVPSNSLVTVFSRDLGWVAPLTFRVR